MKKLSKALIKQQNEGRLKNHTGRKFRTYEDFMLFIKEQHKLHAISMKNHRYVKRNWPDQYGGQLEFQRWNYEDWMQDLRNGVVSYIRLALS